MKKIFSIVLTAVMMTAVLFAQEKTKVACIGDSITYGSGLEDNTTQSYPAVLGEILGNGFQVRNFGISGRCVSHSADYPYTDGTVLDEIKAFAPDVITIMLGTNDSKPQNWNEGTFRNDYVALASKLKALPNRPRVVFFTPTPVWDTEGTIRNSVIKDYILQDIKWLGNDQGCDVVDLYDPFLNKPFLFPDGVHPNAEGARQLAIVAAGACLQRNWREEEKYIPPVEQEVKDRISEWQDLKFGMFIHWGAYSVKGVVESWSICPENVGWQYADRPKDKTYDEYVKEYEALPERFNPVEFAPEKWAEAARYAGMKYVVFTTKHHDGFNMFDTAESDYKVTSPGCPFSSNPRANIAKEVFNAFRAEGLKAGAYYSIADWHHQDYWWDWFPSRNNYINYDPVQFPEKWPRFQNFLVAQMQELTGGDYGELSMLWFDQCIPSLEYAAPVPWDRMAAVARANQPGIMMVARWEGTVYENYRTPEQNIPDEVLDYPWESCITMSNSWSWRPDANYKSTRELLSILVKVVSRGGNLLLNVGPSAKGILDEEAYLRLREIGDWMKVNSEGIYRSKPYPLGGNLYGTTVDGAVYAYYVPVAGDSEELPSEIFVPNVISKDVRMLGAEGTKLKCIPAENGVKVLIPDKLRHDLPCRHIWCLRFR